MQDFDQWYEALEQGRKDVLLDDKWMLARAAYRAGIEAARSQFTLPAYNEPVVIEQ